MSQSTLIEDVGKAAVMGLPFGGPVGALIGGLGGVLMHYAPDLIGGITGQDAEKATATASRVADVVRQITGAETTAGAMAAAQDSAIDAQLQIALATIDREIKQAELAAHMSELTARLDDRENERKAEIAALSRKLDDVAGARSTMTTLVSSGSRIAWAPAIISGIVLAGFFAMSVIVLLKPTPVSEVALVVMGAIVAMAKDSASFWMGSTSSGQIQRDQIVKMADKAQDSVSPAIAKQLGESISPDMVRALTKDGKPPFSRSAS